MFINVLKNNIDTYGNKVFSLRAINNKFSSKYSQETIKRTINELAKRRYITPIIRGFYYKPKFIKMINEYAAPDYNRLAYEIANRSKWQIAPTGERSLNLLGLSRQVSNSYIFASTGPYRQYKVKNVTIIFKRCKFNELVDYSYETKILIQGLKTLGKENVRKDVILQLKKQFSPKLKGIILKESAGTTAWIYKCIKEICL